MVALQNRKGGRSLLHSPLRPTLRFQQDKQGDVTCDPVPQDTSVSCPLSRVGMARLLGSAAAFPGEVSRHNFFNSLRFVF